MAAGSATSLEVFEHLFQNSRKSAAAERRRETCLVRYHELFMLAARKIRRCGGSSSVRMYVRRWWDGLSCGEECAQVCAGGLWVQQVHSLRETG